MGLEIAEFMLALEDELDIHLDESNPFEPGIDVTVGMVIDLVERKIREVERKIREKETAEIMAVDYPQKVFEQTTAILAQYAEVPPQTVTPETLLTDLFADVKRWRKMWRVNDDRTNEMDWVLKQLTLSLNKLDRRIKIIFVCWGLSVMFLAPFLIWLCIGRKNGNIGTVIYFAFFVPSVFWVWRLGRSMFDKSKRFPPHNITVSQFAEAITAHRRRFLAPDGSPISRSAIELRVIEILANTMGMKPNDIMLTDRLVQNLKMG